MLLMLKLGGWLLVCLGALLPHHGAITVFLPAPFRFWKEGILMLLFLIVVWMEFRNVIKNKFRWDKIEIWGVLFLVWLLSLVIINPDRSTALVSARYLGLGFFVFLLVSRFLKQLSEKEKTQLFGRFSKVFLVSCFLSLIFGIWAKYLGGFEFLSHWYSPTISSWVPGQTVPIYHETGAFIRMQGGSSGPTEFAHLLLGALFLVPFAFKKYWVQIFVGMLLFFGIFQSFTRAVILIAVVGGIIFVIQSLKLSRKQITALVVGAFLIFGGIFVQNSNLSKNFVQRAGSSEHLTRPIEAFRLGMAHPFVGNLGVIGPSARAKNLREQNNDQALIAENIFADYFAQLGIVGFLLALGFFIFVFRNISSQGLPFLLAVIITGSIATIFDMTPISIIFFLLFAFFVKSSTIPSKYLSGK